MIALPVLLPLAPYISVLALILTTRELFRFRCERIRHANTRVNETNYYVVLAVINSTYVVIALVYLLPSALSVGITMAIVAGLGILASIALVVIMFAEQAIWKGYWNAILFHVVWKASIEGNHEDLTRAQEFKNQIGREPNIPLSGGFRIYIGLYSGIQAIAGLVRLLLTQP